MTARNIVTATWMGMFAAILYGVIHDQITIRIFAPYLTVWHPKIIESTDPTMVALAWGFAATWWMGVFLGGLLGLACFVGNRRPYGMATVAKTIGFVFVLSGVGAALAGLLASQFGFVAPSSLMGPTIAEMGDEAQHRFSVVWMIHNTSYTVAFWTALGAAVVLYFRRPRLGPEETAPNQNGSGPSEASEADPMARK